MIARIIFGVLSVWCLMLAMIAGMAEGVPFVPRFFLISLPVFVVALLAFGVCVTGKVPREFESPKARRP